VGSQDYLMDKFNLKAEEISRLALKAIERKQKM